MSDHSPREVYAMDIDFSGVHTSIDKIRDAFKNLKVPFVVGDYRHADPHSYHMHLTAYPASQLQRWIQNAQDDLWDAQWLTDGAYRHRTVKAARDELRRLRRLEIRERGWHR